MKEYKYNATIIGKIQITPDLMVLRVKADEPRNKFIAGQYTYLGLLGKELRSPNSVVPIKDCNPNKLIIRPYSIASANVETQQFEFYISQVKSGQLTPRLFNLQQGSRIWLDNDILGLFDLNNTPEGCDIAMVATGTGLAPYISFLRSHLKEHTNIKLAIIHGAAYAWDLGYFSELSLISTMFSNFYYFPTLLKAGEGWAGLEGHIETHLESGLLESKAGIVISPEKTHFYLCGNPVMVESVTNLLAKKNYAKHCKDGKSALHTEEY